MLSNSALSHLKDWIRFCSATGVLPFSWSSSNSCERIIVSTSRLKRLSGMLIIASLTIYSTYYSYQHYATFHNKNGENGQPSVGYKFLPFCWIAIYASGYFWALGSVINFWNNQSAFTAHLNAILKLDSALKTGKVLLNTLIVN